MRVENMLQWAVDLFLAMAGALALVAPTRALGIAMGRPGNGWRGGEAEQFQEALRARERQQAAVAQLGQRGLADTDISGFMDEAVVLTAETLGMEYAKILELLPEGDALLLRAGVGWREGLVGRARVSAHTESQAGYNLLSGEPVIVEDMRSEIRFQDSEMLLDHGVISGMSVVIPGRNRPFGVLGVHTAGRRTFTQDDVHFLEAVAHVLGAAIDRKRTEQALREAESHLSFLAQVGAVLASSLEYEATLTGVAQLAVPRIADWCSIHLTGEGGALRMLAAAQADPGKAEAARELQRQFPADTNAPHGVAQVVRTGQPEVCSHVTDSLLQNVAHDEEHLASLRRLGLNSFMIVPLIARGRTLGAIVFVSAESGRHYGPSDLRLVEDMAYVAALAVDNARLYRDAQRAIQSRDDFLSMAAHELKTPITSLHGFAQLAVRQVDRHGTIDPQQARQTLCMIDHQSRRLTHLVSQLVDVSRIDAGRLMPNRRASDLVDLVKSAIAAARPNADGHTFALRAPSPALAMVDPLLIERVIDNLVDNALRYSPGGGPIEVEVSTPCCDMVQLAVRDHGIGIQPEHREKVFDRYYRAHDGDNLGGLGLGLYISREIVHLHGGRIELESPSDGGSRFVVRLPTGFGGPPSR